VQQLRTALFPPTYRLLLYCLVIGVFGALAALSFDFLVEHAERLLLGGIAGYHPPAAGTLDPTVDIPELAERWWLPVVTTLGGLLSGLLVYGLAPETEGHGTDAAIAAYHRGGEIRGRSPLVKALASAAIIGSGGVAGREGPTAQIASGLGAAFGRLVGVRGQERRILLLASMSAGLAAVFRAPLGMAIFAVEILYSGMVFESEALIYTVVAAVTAYALHGLVMGWEPIFAIPGDLAFEEPRALIGYALLGVFAGILGALLPTGYQWFRRAFLRLPGPPHYKPALGGLLVGLVGIAVPQALGTGYGWVELAMAGTLPLGTMALILLLKAPAMSLTIGSGGSGGVFGPTVVMGAMLGGITGIALNGLFPVLELHTPAFVLVGMAAVFAAAARAPISTLIMTVEMTGGYGLIVPTMLANVLAFIVQRSLTVRSRHPTLYDSQVATREDSPAHRGVFIRRALELIEEGDIEPTALTLPRLVNLLKYGEALSVGHGGGMLVAVQVEEGSELDLATVGERIGPIGGASTVAILRGEEMLVPRGPTRFGAGDQVILLATPEAREQVEALARKPR
jgi:CIC family chloride channel protein